MVNEIIKGDEWAAYGMLGRLILTKRGITYPARASGDRALGVLAGVTPCQGAWESHAQGKAAQVRQLRGKSTRCAESEPREGHHWRAG